MDGAVRSGERAAKEVLGAVRRALAPRSWRSSLLAPARAPSARGGTQGVRPDPEAGLPRARLRRTRTGASTRGPTPTRTATACRRASSSTTATGRCCARGRSGPEPRGAARRAGRHERRRGRIVLLDKTPPRMLLLDPRPASRPVRVVPRGRDPELRRLGAGRQPVRDRLRAADPVACPAGRRHAPAVAHRPAARGGGEFGTTGIELAGDRAACWWPSRARPAAAAATRRPAGCSACRSARRQARPDAELWESGPVDGPDGFGIAQSGNDLQSQPRLEPDRRWSGRTATSASASRPCRGAATTAAGAVRLPVERELPRHAADGREPGVLRGDPTHQAILDVEAGEPGLPELIPPAAKAKPAKRLAGKRKKFRKKKRKPRP